MSLSERLERPDAPQARPFLQGPIPGTEPAPAGDLTEAKARVQARLLELLGQQIYTSQVDVETLERVAYEAISDVLESIKRPLSGADRNRLVQEVIDEILGHGPLEPLLRDDAVTEIMVNRWNDVWVERQGRLHSTEHHFESEDHLRRTIDRIVGRVGRRIDESSPMVDARLPDGSRVNAVIPPISLDGATLTIRKFVKDLLTAEHLISLGTITPAAMEVMEAAVRGKLNILISGGTGSGKTTTLNVLSACIPADERIITIEDAAELQLNQPHVVRLESRPINIEGQGLVTIRDLVRNSLRMRPDRIIVGEVRDAAALDMLQAMNTGHEGSLTTVHANSSRDALSRIETMVMYAGAELPVRVVREQIVTAIDVVLQQARLRDGTRKVIAISEVTGMEGDTIQTQDLFKFSYSHDVNRTGLGTLEPTGIMPTFMSKLADRGVSLSRSVFTK